MSNKIISDELLKILACPKDKSAVEKTPDGNLKCPKCKTIYKVIDGIPVMLIDDEYTSETKSDEEFDKDINTVKKKNDIKFKPHPLLSAKKKHKNKIVFKEGCGEDPFLLAARQNEAHKFRLAKTTALILLITFSLFLLYLLYEHIERKIVHEKEINTIAMKISDCRKIISSSDAYESAKAAFAALCYIETIKMIDWNNNSEWEGRKDFFMKVIEEESTPESNKTFISGSIPLDMVNIPQGVFAMGSTVKDKRAEEDELPQRNVIINYEFWISRTEVSNMQFKFAYPNHRVEDWAEEKLDELFQPAVMMDWHMAMSFCRFLNEKELKAGRIPESYEYRLPTEVEWEYAARAGTTNIFFWGDKFGDEGAKFANTFDIRTSRIHKWRTEKEMASNDAYVASAAVGSFKPNAFGLFDTCGNVWEWCWDWYNPRAYKELDLISPIQTQPVSCDLEMLGTFDRPYTVEGTSKVIRGGSWGNLPSSCRSGNRDSSVPEKKNNGIGFRVVLAPKIDKLTETYDKNTNRHTP
jgi:formylglycine-generating enzyme required for sulfatase activity/uncharacterized protein YbaR (Trm112 family)